MSDQQLGRMPYVKPLTAEQLKEAEKAKVILQKKIQENHMLTQAKVRAVYASNSIAMSS